MLQKGVKQPNKKDAFRRIKWEEDGSEGLIFFVIWLTSTTSTNALVEVNHLGLNFVEHHAIS